MNPLKQLEAAGQSPWLDYVSRSLIASGDIAVFIARDGLKGMTSNPAIFEKAIAASHEYDDALAAFQAQGDHAITEIYEHLAIADIQGAADALMPVYQATKGVDGYISLEVSPYLAHDEAGTIAEARRLWRQVDRANLMVKVPATPAGVGAIRQLIADGINVNVTLLFSCRQYEAAAEAYLRGIERRIQAGRDPQVGSVASLFISRWDVAVKDKLVPRLRNRLGIAVAMQTYQAYCALLETPRWRKLAQAGARAQRVLWASTGTKDPQASDTLYVEALAAPNTIDTIPEKTLLAFAGHGRLGRSLPWDGGDAPAVLADFAREGIDPEVLAERLQREGTEAFVESWRRLLNAIGSKATQLAQAGP